MTESRLSSGRVAVVTGSTVGIGKAAALALCDAGYDLIINSRQADERAHDALAQLRVAGTRVVHIPTDVSDPTALADFVQQAWAWQGSVDLWVNNAGADVLSGGAWKDDWEQRLEQLLATDLWGTVRCSRWVGQRMVDQGFGQIINIGWDQAERGGVSTQSGQLFSLIKGGLMAFTRSLAGALAPAVRVNCVAPGWIETEWGEGVSPDLYRRIQADIPLDRWGTPEDVANAIAWLASPQASYITGQTIYVNGGISR